jgi:hypothetical protein
MALACLALDGAAIDAIDVVAHGSWEPDRIDATWRRAGWPAPRDRPVSQLVFERMEYRIEVGDRFVGMRMSHDPDAITGLVLDFAVFYAPTDAEDPDLIYLVESFADRGWLVDATAGSERFDDAWRQGCAALVTRLGAPALIGQHAPSWRHAAWRVGQRWVVIAQGEDFASYSLYDAASVWVVAAPPGGDIPTGDRLYAFLCGDTSGDADPGVDSGH